MFENGFLEIGIRMAYTWNILQILETSLNIEKKEKKSPNGLSGVIVFLIKEHRKIGVRNNKEEEPT